MLLVKNIKLGKVNKKKITIFLTFFLYFSFNFYLAADNKSQDVHFIEIKILDKISSKTIKLNLKINEEKTV